MLKITKQQDASRYIEQFELQLSKLQLEDDVFVKVIEF